MSKKQIEEFLRENKPIVKENPTFLLEAQRKMRSVEGIKAEVDRQRRYGRTILICTLVAGMLLGAISIAIAYIYPIKTDILGEGLWENIRLFMDAWKAYLIIPVVGCAIALRNLTKRPCL